MIKLEYFGFILLSIVVLLLMVLIHELGHYSAAKILGFTVDEFSVGFGPKLISKIRRNGERFSLRALPLGGYCAFYGDAEDDEETPKQDPTDVNEDKTVQAASIQQSEPGSEDLLSYVMRTKKEEEAGKDVQVGSQAAAVVTPVEASLRLDKNGKPALGFYDQKPWKRIIVLLGGVVFNFLSAIVFSLIYIWAVGCPTVKVAEVYADGTTPYSRLQKGDVILSVNGQAVTVMDSYNDMIAEVKEGQTVKLKVDRGGKIISVDVLKQKIKYTDKDGKVEEYVGLGFSSLTEFIGADASNAFKYCVPYTFKLSWSIIGSFGQLITGKVPITSVTGPVGSVKLMADVTLADWRNILILLPLLASNLAIFNLLPFPALDGAQIVFTIVEWIRKKPIKRKIQGIINAVGLITLLLFVVIVDILSFAL